MYLSPRFAMKHSDHKEQINLIYPQQHPSVSSEHHERSLVKHFAHTSSRMAISCALPRRRALNSLLLHIYLQLPARAASSFHFKHPEGIITARAATAIS
jgi:hypothetical protein